MIQKFWVTLFSENCTLEEVRKKYTFVYTKVTHSPFHFLLNSRDSLHKIFPDWFMALATSPLPPEPCFVRKGMCLHTILLRKQVSGNKIENIRYFPRHHCSKKCAKSIPPPLYCNIITDQNMKRLYLPAKWNSIIEKVLSLIKLHNRLK